MGDSGDQERSADQPAPEALRVKQAPTPVDERSHRWHWFTGRAHELVDELAGSLTATMTESERAETAAEALRLQDRLAAMISALVTDDPGTVAAVRDRTRITAQTARRLTRRARAAEEHPEVQAALSGGEIHLDQAEVIIQVIDKLPEEVSHLKKEAEQHLLELALDHDAQELKGMADHLLHVVAPDLADELLARQLEREERDARRAACLKIYRDGHGSTWIKGRIPDLHGHLLETLLNAVANPQRPGAIDRSNRDLPEIKGRAFCELLEKIKVRDLPKTGGTAVAVVVTMTIGTLTGDTLTGDTLTGDVKAAGVLGTELRISPGEARRLAATHGVIPVVLGAKSEVLDVGRRRRFFTQAQRVAMALRQGGVCNIRGCDIPAAWCDANHRHDWAKGGRTDLKDGELVCPKHHTGIHQGASYPRRT